MADSNEQSWWRRTRFLAMVALTAGGTLCILSLILPLPDLGRFFSLPFATFVATIAAPILAILSIFWLADRQKRLDRAHGYNED
jgi:putative solute:sodium symporter small subunit